MKASIYRELLAEARKLIHKKKYRQAAEMIVSPIWIAYGDTVNTHLKNVYLAGVSRVGKTRLASLLSQQGYLVIAMDELREYYWSSSTAYQDVSDIDSCRNALYQVLNDYFPSGVCIEGSDVYFHTIKRHQKLSGNYTLFALGVNPSAVLPKAVSMYRAAKTGHCRGLMTFQEAERIAIAQSQIQEDLTKMRDSNFYYLEMMRCINADRSLELARKEVLHILRSKDKGEVGNTLDVSVEKMDEKTFQERLNAVAVAHEKERDDLLLQIEHLLKENAYLRRELERERTLIFSEAACQYEQEENALGLDFSLPEE